MNGSPRTVENAGAAVPRDRAADEVAFFMRGGSGKAGPSPAALEAELNALGISRGEWTTGLLARAVILRRHGIPLSRAFLQDAAGEGDVAARMIAMRAEVAAVLDNLRLPSSLRTALVEFLTSTDSLFSRPPDIAFITESVDALLDVKTVILERLFRIAGENPAAVRDFIAEGADETRIAFELAAGLRGNAHGGGITESEAAAAMNAFRTALGELMNSSMADRAQLDRLFPMLAESLHAAADTVIAASGGRMPDIAAGLIAGFVRETVNDLHVRLAALISGYDHQPSESGESSLPGIRTLLRRSGFGFEWRLLMWYRAGRDPERISALVRDDYKGMLMRLTAKLRQAAGAEQPGRLERLEQQARRLLDAINRGQLDMLHGREQSRDALPPIPLSADGMDRFSLLRPRDEAPDNKGYDGDTSVVFTVTTSKLGSVSVEMRHTDSRLSVLVGLPDEEVREYTGSAADDLRESLATQGYDVSSIAFTLTSGDGKMPNGRGREDTRR